MTSDIGQITPQNQITRQSNQARVYAAIASSTQTLPNASNTTILFNTLDTNASNNSGFLTYNAGTFTNATGRFINVMIFASLNVTATRCDLSINRGGTQYGLVSSSSGYISTSCIIGLSIGGTFVIMAQNFTGADQTAGVNFVSHTRVQVALLI